jgi:branched-chain amino acid transport system permease protein
MELGFETLLPDAAFALFAMVNVIAALSLNVINGMAGQFSIGHAGFVGIGAYTAARRVELRPRELGDRRHPVRELVHRDAPRHRLRGGPRVALRAASWACRACACAATTSPSSPSVSPRSSGSSSPRRRRAATRRARHRGPRGARRAERLRGPDGNGVPQYAGPFWIFGGMVLAT